MDLKLSESSQSGSGEKRQNPNHPIDHMHHMAFRCRDAEQTRWFWEEILGLELTLALTFDKEPGSNRPVEYMHLFFQSKDGNFIAFFDAPDTVEESMFVPKHGFDLHIAFECEDMEELKAWRRRINRMGRPCFGPIDHDFVHSIYMYDPNGIQVEITTKDARFDEIVAEEKPQVDKILKEWTERTREKKLNRLKAEDIDTREVDMSKVTFGQP